MITALVVFILVAGLLRRRLAEHFAQGLTEFVKSAVIWVLVILILIFINFL